eukprot:CAMPEP_0180830792 /NCGR_PEP_ID=MMETSP1038_2-20121128/76000_1 /TAXON_ID=632150 /ORGANISM="Azadinium spinosum, Strain 3D9" /LENGTH=278 /DNA_ID=CAMNT_0022873959 /DNA_START=159 /DNA_END=993 /DNA_ORIENTATION=-
MSNNPGGLLLLWKEVDLVPYLDHARFHLGRRHPSALQGAQHSILMHLPLGIRDVADVYEDVAIHKLLERGLEGGKEVMWQVLDKADAVCNDGLATARQLHTAQGSVQGLEEEVPLLEPRIREPIHQRRLACIGIAHNADGRDARSAAAMQLPRPRLHDQLLLQPYFRQLQHVALALERGLLVVVLRIHAGIPASDLMEGAHVLLQQPHRLAQAGLRAKVMRLFIFQACQADLELRLRRFCAQLEDIENKTIPVQNLTTWRGFAFHFAILLPALLGKGR